jgi:hypothetical protein
VSAIELEFSGPWANVSRKVIQELLLLWRQFVSAIQFERQLNYELEHLEDKATTSTRKPQDDLTCDN